MDFETTLQTIGAGNLMAVGARDFVHGEDGFTMRVGNKRGLLEKVVVAQDELGYYSVRYVAYKGRASEPVVDEWAHDLDARYVGAYVRKMGDRA